MSHDVSIGQLREWISGTYKDYCRYFHVIAISYPYCKIRFIDGSTAAGWHINSIYTSSKLTYIKDEE